MAHLLRIDSSALSQESHSKSLANFFTSLWQQNLNGTLTQVDLSQNPPPHIDEKRVHAMYTPESERTDEQKASLQLSDYYISQLKQADELLIDVPMYNFSIPSTLKAYIDHVVRAGLTFSYGENGPQGLLTNIQKATIIIASGGDYTHPPMNQMDFVTPYLKTILNFIGIETIHFINAPKMALGEQNMHASLTQAQNEITQLFS